MNTTGTVNLDTTAPPIAARPSRPARAIAFGKYGPASYSLAIIAISLPRAWAGARLRRRLG